MMHHLLAEAAMEEIVPLGKAFVFIRHATQYTCFFQ